jgi:hypothetical protein
MELESPQIAAGDAARHQPAITPLAETPGMARLAGLHPNDPALRLPGAQFTMTNGLIQTHLAASIRSHA